MYIFFSSSLLCRFSRKTSNKQHVKENGKANGSTNGYHTLVNGNGLSNGNGLALNGNNSLRQRQTAQ